MLSLFILGFPAVNIIVAYGALTWGCLVEFLILDPRWLLFTGPEYNMLYYVQLPPPTTKTPFYIFLYLLVLNCFVLSAKDVKMFDLSFLYAFDFCWPGSRNKRQSSKGNEEQKGLDRWTSGCWLYVIKRRRNSKAHKGKSFYFPF